VLGLSELHAAFNGRGVLAKHKSYSMYRASTVLVAKSIVDAPIYAVQNFIYVAIIYWMSGMQSNAGLFFICFLFTWVVTMVFSTMFRSIGYAFNEYNDASKVSGAIFIFFVVVSESYH
jgi:ABC-type multidrug transport system permease subunit